MSPCTDRYMYKNSLITTARVICVHIFMSLWQVFHTSWFHKWIFSTQSLPVIGWQAMKSQIKWWETISYICHLLIKADFWYQETRKWPIIHPNISLQSLLSDSFPYLPGLLYYTILSNSFQVNKYYLYIYIYNRTHIYYISSTQWLAARSKQTWVSYIKSDSPWGLWPIF